MKTVKLITSYDDHNKVYHKTTFDVHDLDDITTTMREEFFDADSAHQYYRDQWVELIEPVYIPWHENRPSDDSVRNYEYFYIRTCDSDNDCYDYYVAFPCYIDLYIKNWGSNIEIKLDSPLYWSPDASFTFHWSDYIGLSPDEVLETAMERITDYTDPIPEEYANKIHDALETYFDALPEPDELEVM